jgi:hypothetical protein
VRSLGVKWELTSYARRSVEVSIFVVGAVAGAVLAAVAVG